MSRPLQTLAYFAIHPAAYPAPGATNIQCRICETRKAMKLDDKVLARVQDVEGGLWDVVEIRDTNHGFDLLFGAPAPQVGTDSWGIPRLIVTQSLYDFWEAHRTGHSGASYDLPAGRTTLKRARRRLGFCYLVDLANFWQSRMEDLKTLSAREFATQHGIDISVVWETRMKLLGRQAREPDWWRKPRPLKILRSKITLREMGEKLSISISQAKRLSDQARGAVSPPIGASTRTTPPRPPLTH